MAYKFVGLLRGAELEFAVCQAQKCPLMPQNPKSNMAATVRASFMRERRVL